VSVGRLVPADTVAAGIARRAGDRGHALEVRRLVSATLIIAVTIAAGCSSSSSEHCDTVGAARLCVLSKSGGYQITGTGLQPGSTINPTLNGTFGGPALTVKADGTFAGGTLAFLGGSGGDFVVTGVGAAGQHLRVALHAG
jgi:hypothetical protein